MRPLLLLISLIPLTLLAGPLDSLKAELHGLSEEVKLEIIRHELNRYEDRDRADFNQLKSFLESLKFTKEEGQAKLNDEIDYSTAKWFEEHDRIDTTLLLLHELETRVKADNRALRSDILNQLSYLYLDLGSTDKSLKYGLAALELADTLNDRGDYIENLNNIGETYRHINEFERSLEFYEKALKIAYRDNDSNSLPRLLNNSGISLTQMNQFEEAEERLKTGLAFCEEINSDFCRSRFLTNIGFLFKEKGEYEKALDYYEKSIEVKERIGDPKSLAYSLNDYGEVLSFMGKPKEGLEFSMRALKLAEESGAIYYERDMNLTIAHTFEILGEFDSAYAYLERYQNIQEQILNEDAEREIARLEQLNELNESRLQNQVLRSENELQTLLISRQKWIIATFIVLLLALAVFGSVLYRTYQQKQGLLRALNDQNQELDQQNKDLKQLIEERESLFNIVAHDLKAPLANIITLLDLESEEESVAAKAEFRHWMRQSANHGMSFIQEFNRLMEFEKLDQIPTGEEFDLVNLMQEVIEEFRLKIEAKKLGIHFNSTNELKVKSVKPFVKHICLNIFSNAVKFSPEGGSIFISISNSEKIRISIQDQGPGIPKENLDRIFQRFFRTQSDTEMVKNSNGLGLSLVKLLIEKLDGRVKVNSSIGEGTEFIVYL